MESHVSKLESLFEDFQKEFKDSIVEFHESRLEFRATHKLILQQLQFLSSKGGGSVGESSEATHSDPNLQMGTNPNFVPNSFRQEITSNTLNQRQPFLKMDFPRFGDGDEPLGWIYKAEHYFDFFHIEEFKKVKMTSFHLEGEPLQWFQWADCISNYPKWEDFTRALCQEFGPSEFEDAAESLVKLRQTGSLRDYVLEFRRLANRTRDMTHSLLKSCFIGGLKAELRHDVKILKPRDVLAATAYAQQLDAKLSDLKVKYFPHSSVNSSYRTPLQMVNIGNIGENKLKADTIRRLTPEKVEYCRKHGLCFHCKEQYARGHSCEKKQLLLIDVHTPYDDESSDDENLEPEITFCALFGTPAPKSIKTMKVLGCIKKCRVIILIDSGTSHNFIDSSLVKKINGLLDTSHSFSVKIADRGEVNTIGPLGAISLKIQNYQCITDLYAMPLGGCDIVLGVQWLRTMGPVLWDFDKMYMKFTKGDVTHCLSSPETPSEQI